MRTILWIIFEIKHHRNAVDFFINQLSFNLCNISLNFRSGRINCKSYSAEDRSSIENEDDDLHDDIGDDQVRLK